MLLEQQHGKVKKLCCKVHPNNQTKTLFSLGKNIKVFFVAG